MGPSEFIRNKIDRNEPDMAHMEHNPFQHLET